LRIHLMKVTGKLAFVQMPILWNQAFPTGEFRREHRVQWLPRLQLSLNLVSDLLRALTGKVTLSPSLLVKVVSCCWSVQS